MSDALSAGLSRPSAERLAADLAALEAFTRPDRPYTSWSSCSASTVISPERARRGSAPVGSRRLRGAPRALPRA